MTKTQVFRFLAYFSIFAGVVSSIQSWVAGDDHHYDEATYYLLRSVISFGLGIAILYFLDQEEKS